ncbi:MAG: 2-vinyl bacteriochlorophyllide hydratase [Methylotenera sp.]|jgi:3-vinyl bacteriochlorophyllide hydratase|nr:2-vinyl bacteriochlorophyllide hydratase [Methylotenera sp.]
MTNAFEPPISTGLYTPQERARRDATIWTPVQGFLAAFQFIVFAVSVCLIARYMVTGEGETAAVWSVVFKTLVLYAIMVTGSIWEKVVFDKWLFAPAFFWEDVFSFLVLGLHTAYLWSLYTGNMGTRDQLWLALAAYAAYAINAGQFLLKLRAARAQERATLAMHQELAT